VAVTQGLLDRLEPDELEGVIAHELSHVAHRDVAIMTIASFFAMVAGFITRWGFFFGGGFGGGDDDNNSGNAFIIVLLVSIVVYALSFVLIRTLSRYREFAADRGAAVLTKSPSSLASALVKISGAMGRIPQRDMRMAEGLNQFFIIPAGLKSGFSTLFADHPPLEARLEQLRRLERGLEGL
jgi:heat shock protein HtpX